MINEELWGIYILNNKSMWSTLLYAFQEELATHNPIFQLIKSEDYKLS